MAVSFSLRNYSERKRIRETNRAVLPTVDPNVLQINQLPMPGGYPYPDPGLAGDTDGPYEILCDAGATECPDLDLSLSPDRPGLQPWPPEITE